MFTLWSSQWPFLYYLIILIVVDFMKIWAAIVSIYFLHVREKYNLTNSILYIELILPVIGEHEKWERLEVYDGILKLCQILINATVVDNSGPSRTTVASPCAF